MILLISLILLLFAYRVYRTVNGSFKIFTITNMFLLSYVVFVYIGILCIQFGFLDEEEAQQFATNQGITLRMWVYTTLGFFFILSGILVAYAQYPRVKTIQSKVVSKGIDYALFDVSKKNRTTIYLLLAVSVFVLLLYRKNLGGLPLESILLGLSKSDLSLLRSDATNNFSGTLYRYDMFMHILPMMLLLFAGIIRKQGGKKWSVLFYILLVYNVFFSLTTLQKGPIVRLILLLVSLSIYQGRKISMKYVIAIGGMGVGVIILMYIFFMGMGEYPVSAIIQTATHRIFISTIAPLFWYIKYTDIHGFLWGATFPNPGGLLPFNNIPLTVEVQDLAVGIGDIVGSMPTVFIGEAYANFGVVGVCIVSFLFGFMIQTMDNVFLSKLKKHKSVGLSVLFLYLLNYFSRYAESSFSPLFTDYKFYFPIVIYLIYNHISRKRRDANNENNLSCDQRSRIYGREDFSEGMPIAGKEV